MSTSLILIATAKSDQRAIDFNIPFEVDKVKMPTTRYPLNETVLIEGQKIIIKQIEISPLKVAIHVECRSSEYKRNFWF